MPSARTIRSVSVSRLSPAGGRHETVGAAVDVGSTSVHLLVARVRGHALTTLADESVFLELAQRVDAAGALGPEGRAELTAALGRYAGAARSLGAASPTFVGTEPLRAAADGARAAAEVEAATGVPLLVLAHDEEACLTLLGVTGGRPVTDELAVLDIGGGSSEVVHASPRGGVTVEGVRIGAARLCAAVVRHDPPTADELAALRAEAAGHVVALSPIAPEELVAVGGTATNLARVLGDGSPGPILTRARLREALEVLASGPAAEVAEVHGLNPVRARVLPAGAAILDAILERYGLDAVRVAAEGIREGVVLAVAHRPLDWRDRLSDLAIGWE